MDQTDIKIKYGVTVWLLAVFIFLMQSRIANAEYAVPAIDIAQNSEASQNDVMPIIDKYKPRSPNIRYTANERRSVEIAKRLNKKQLSVYEADNGSVQYVFGQAQAVIVCTPMRLCNVSLEAGEIVNDVHLGDTIRWEVSPSVSGEAPNQVVHAVIKPSEVGIETSMMITTDRRVYHMTLKSAAEDYMPSVTFHYPSAQVDDWAELVKTQSQEAAAFTASMKAARDDEIAAAAAEAEKNAVTPRLGIAVNDLNFNYSVTGGREYSWNPLRVFDDGIRTFIELPFEALNGDVPIILAADSTNEIVNYRLKGNRYIVDGISNRLIMLKDVGRKQQRLTVERDQ